MLVLCSNMVLNQSVHVHVFALGYFLNVHGMNAKTVLVVRTASMCSVHGFGA